MIALDIETCSLDPRRGSIVSLGAIDTDNPTNQFYDECRIWDGAHVDDESLVINGFTRDEIVEITKISEAELIAAFVTWATDRIGDRTIVGQNPSFDRDYAAAACHRAGIDFPFAHRTLDTHTLCWLHMTLRRVAPPTIHDRSAISLDYALEYCGLPHEPRPHNALTGAASHAEVFARIAYNKSIVPEYNAYPIPWLTT